MDETSPPPVPRRPSDRRSGCTTAILIIAGVGGALLISGFIAVWLFFRSDTGQRWVGLAREGYTMSREAMNAPGTDVLRANGCSQAMVVETGRMMELLADVVPQVKDDPDLQRFGGRMVICQVSAADAGPDCPEVARTYAGSVPDAPERFMVTVQPPSSREPRCQGVYERDGTLIEPLGRGRPSDTPQAPPPADVDVERK